MDKITKKIKDLNIEDTELTIYENNCSLNVQKCFVSETIFKENFKKPGQIALININNDFILCKIFPKKLFPVDRLEINKSIQCLNFYQKKNINGTKLKLFNIKLQNTIQVFIEIRVKIVFESLEIIKMYKDKEVANILRQNILKHLVVGDNYRISLECLPKVQKMGIFCVEILESNPLGIGTISSRTKVNIIDKLTFYQYEQMQKSENQLFSLDHPMKRLIEIIEINEKYSKEYAGNVFAPSKQVLLVGPSGCGKSSLVRLVGKKTGCTIVHIFGHEVNKKDPGETESTLREKFISAFEYAKLSGKCIINLEDVDNLCPHIKGSSSHIQRAVSQLLTLLDRAHTVPGVIVIGTTNKVDSIDPSIRRQGRLETEIYIGPPTEIERENILSNFIKSHSYIAEEIRNDLCKNIAAMTPGYVGADLELLYNKIDWKIHQGMISFDYSINHWKNEFRKVIADMSPASLKGTLGAVSTKHLSLDDLAGVDDIIKVLEMSIIWPMKHSDSFARFRIPRPKGILLYGPPGCAKTSLVRALVSLGTFSLLAISAAELYSPYVGDAERLIRQLFERARQNSPCIFFIDEIDALAGSRGEKNQMNSEVQDRIIATLLTQMDGVGHKMLAADIQNPSDGTNDGVIVVGSTNRPDMIDSALLRPGRFDKHIFVPPPNYDARLQIFKCITRKMPVEDIDFDFFAKSTDLYSGADIKSICTEAALLAMTEEGVHVKFIKNYHFVKSLNNSRSSLTESQCRQYDKFRNNK